MSFSSSLHRKKASMVKRITARKKSQNNNDTIMNSMMIVSDYEESCGIATVQVGGDSSLVQNRLRGVLQVCASETAFAALLTSGEVVTWGDAAYGGDLRE